MPNTRLSMRHIKEILRLKLEAKLSHRQVARSLGIGVGTVSVYGKRASALNLCWPWPTEMSDNELEQLLFPSPSLSARYGRVMPDCAAIHQELKRKGVTKQLLWEEYKQAYGDADLIQNSIAVHRFSFDWMSIAQLSRVEFLTLLVSITLGVRRSRGKFSNGSM